VGSAPWSEAPEGAYRPAGVPAEARRQWEADWNDPAFSAARAHFRGDSRPTGTPRERYDLLCPFYHERGIERPLKYAAEEITTASFFDLRTPAHRDLAAALARAEGILRARGHTTAPVEEGWAFNARTTSKGAWSNHADGRAIDFDSPTNPHLTGEFECGVISALTGVDVRAENPAEGTGARPYGVLKAASDRFRAAYSREGLTRRIGELKAQEARQSGEAARAAAEQRRLLEEELAYVEGELPSVVELAREITRLGERLAQQRRSVGFLEQQLGESTFPAERAELRRRLEAERRALDETVQRLRTAERGRDAHYLRAYARTGFLSLVEEFVDALKAAGLEWGGDWEGAKDFMHFELPGCGGRSGGC
jgi:hypothetical protein